MNDGHRVLHDLTEQPQYGLHLKRYSDSWISELCAGAESGCTHEAERKPHCGWSDGSGCIAIISTRTIGDLPDSDLWSGRSCITARQQVEAAQPPTSLYRRLARLQFMVGQVVLHCAAARGGRTAAGRASRAALRGSKWVQAQPAGSKWKPHCGRRAGERGSFRLIYLVGSAVASAASGSTYALTAPALAISSTASAEVA